MVTFSNTSRRLLRAAIQTCCRISTHVGEDGLEEAVGDLLELAELLRAHRPTVVTVGDLDERPEGVVGLGGDAHARSLSDRSD